jgi:predicted kinase
VLIHANLALQQVHPLLEQVENPEDKVALYIGTMCHDFGKKAVFAISPKHGRITAYGHESAGVPIANDFLKKYFPEFQYPMREKILRLIEYHMKPRMMMKDGTSDKKLKLMSLAVNTKLLYLLSTADTLGRIAEDMSGCELLAKFKAECERLDIWGKPYVIPGSGFMSNHGYSNARWNILMHDDPETNETMQDSEELIMNAVPRFQLLLLVGAPGSGKSTIREQLVKQSPDVVVISMDDRRKELTGDANDQTLNSEVFAWQQRELYKAMKAKKNVIVDATNTTRKLRKILWDIGRRYGAAVGAFYWDLPLETLLARNASREKRVPDSVVRRFYNTLESVMPWEADKIKIFDA